MRWIVVLLAFLAAQAGPDVGFAWLEGGWRSNDGGQVTTERWTRAADGTLEGTLERRQRGKVVGNERMAIASADGKAVLAAAVPEDQESMRYVETARGDRSITFERAADVYPHRLRYWREGKQLVAEISRRDGSEAFRWRYRRVGR